MKRSLLALILLLSLSIAFSQNAIVDFFYENINLLAGIIVFITVFGIAMSAGAIWFDNESSIVLVALGISLALSGAVILIPELSSIVNSALAYFPIFFAIFIVFALIMTIVFTKDDPKGKKIKGIAIALLIAALAIIIYINQWIDLGSIIGGNSSQSMGTGWLWLTLPALALIIGVIIFYKLKSGGSVIGTGAGTPLSAIAGIKENDPRSIKVILVKKEKVGKKEILKAIDSEIGVKIKGNDYDLNKEIQLFSGDPQLEISGLPSEYNYWYLETGRFNYTCKIGKTSYDTNLLKDSEVAEYKTTKKTRSITGGKIEIPKKFLNKYNILLILKGPSAPIAPPVSSNCELEITVFNDSTKTPLEDAMVSFNYDGTPYNGSTKADGKVSFSIPGPFSGTKIDINIEKGLRKTEIKDVEIKQGSVSPSPIILGAIIKFETKNGNLPIGGKTITASPATFQGYTQDGVPISPLETSSDAGDLGKLMVYTNKNPNPVTFDCEGIPVLIPSISDGDNIPVHFDLSAAASTNTIIKINVKDAYKNNFENVKVSLIYTTPSVGPFASPEITTVDSKGNFIQATTDINGNAELIIDNFPVGVNYKIKLEKNNLLYKHELGDILQGITYLIPPINLGSVVEVSAEQAGIPVKSIITFSADTFMDEDGNYLLLSKTSTDKLNSFKAFFNTPIDAEITGELDGIILKKKITYNTKPSPVIEDFEFPTQLKVVIVEEDPAHAGKYRVVDKDDNVTYGQPCIEYSAGSIKNLGNKYDVSGTPHHNYFHLYSATNLVITFNEKDYTYNNYLDISKDKEIDCKLDTIAFNNFLGNENNIKLNFSIMSFFSGNILNIDQTALDKKYNYLVVLREENQQAKQQQQEIEDLKDTIKDLQTQLQSMQQTSIPSNNQDILDKIDQANALITTLLNKSNDLASKQQIEELSEQTRKLAEKVENMIIKDYDANFKELKELIEQNQSIPADLLDKLQKLTESVDSLKKDNTSEHNKLLKKIEESEENIIKSFKEALSQELSGLEKKINNEDIKNKIEDVKSELEQKLGNLSTSQNIHDLAEQINEVRQDLKNDISNIKFDAVTAKLDELNSTFTAILTNITTDIEEIKNKNLPDLKDNSEDLKKLIEQIKDINDTITVLNSSLYSQGELTQNEISEIKGKINDLLTNFAQLSNNFKTMSGEFEDLKSTIDSQVSKDYDANFEKIEKQINELKDILTKFVGFLNMPSPPSNAPLSPQVPVVSSNNFTIKGKILCLLPITGFNIKICKHTQNDIMGDILYGETTDIIVQDSLFECIIDKNINEDLDIWMGTGNNWAKYGTIKSPYNDLNDERFVELKE